MHDYDPPPAGRPRAPAPDNQSDRTMRPMGNDAQQEDDSMMNRMPAMPKMSGATHDCACGCGMPTKREWHSGHDGRATGWAIRIEKGILTIDEVPSNERKGALIMLKRRGMIAMPEPKVKRTRETKATEPIKAIEPIEQPGEPIDQPATGTEG